MTNLFQLYLSQYGYLGGSTRSLNSSALQDERVLRKAIEDFQSFAGLEVTGKLTVPDNYDKHFEMGNYRCIFFVHYHFIILMWDQ